MWMDATNSTQSMRVSSAMSLIYIQIRRLVRIKSSSILNYLGPLIGPNSAYTTDFPFHISFADFYLSTCIAKAHYVFVGWMLFFVHWMHYCTKCLDFHVGSDKWHYKHQFHTLVYAIAHAHTKSKQTKWTTESFAFFCLASERIDYSSRHIYFIRAVFSQRDFHAAKDHVFCRLKWKRTRRKKIKKTKWVIHD